MGNIPEEAVTTVIEGGNGTQVLIPQAGGQYLKLSYLWGKLRVDKCDEDGKIQLPARRGGGSDIPTAPVT